MVLSPAMDFGSSRLNAGRVKTDSTLHRLFDGWQVGLVVIVTAVLAVLIAVPRPTLPDEIPLPRVDNRSLAAISRRDERWAREAEQNRLHFDLRALGESFRAYGKAESLGDREAVARQLNDLRQLLVPALRQGQEGLLRLRAAQLRIFLDGLDRFEQTGEQSDDLGEVGGSVVAMLRRSGWVRYEGQHRQVVPGRYVREVLFRKRWNEITGLDGPAFRPTLDEDRAFYAFLLSHPIASPPPMYAGNPAVRCRSANEYLLRKVDELGKLDPSYPTSYARGVLLLRLGRPKDALLPLADFVEAHDDGPYVLRARNALRTAQDAVAKAAK